MFFQRTYTVENGIPSYVRRDCSYGDCPNWSEEAIRRDLVLIYDEHDCCFIDNCNNEKYMTTLQAQSRIPERPAPERPPNRGRGRYPDDDEETPGSGLKGVRTYVVDVSKTTPIPPRRQSRRPNGAPKIMAAEFSRLSVVVVFVLLHAICT